MDPDPPDRAERMDVFSTWLARERELRGMSREAVVRVTRLAPAVVEALESGDAERMPPRAYVLGYLRAYAGALGLDPDEAVLRFEEAAGREGARAKRTSLELPRRLAAVLALAAAAAAAAWVWLR